MPRWAEGLIIIVVGIVLTIGLMVYAKWSSRPPAADVAASPGPAPAAAGATAPAEAPPPGTLLAERPPPRSSASPTRVAPSPAVEAAPTLGAPVAFALPVAPPVPAPELARVPYGPPAPEGYPPEEKAPEPPPELGAAPEGAARGSKEELALLEATGRALEVLHNLRLRTDVPPAAAEAEAKKLADLLQQLSPETRKEVRKVIAEGYGRRMKGASNDDDLSQRGAEAAEVQRSEAGQVDDTPSDLKTLNLRIAALREQLKIRPTPEPVNAREEPPANAREVPASAPREAPPEAQPSEAPEGVQPVNP